MSDLFTIRPFQRADIDTVTDWARLEGFAPGLGDVSIYRQTDRQGVWLGCLGDSPIGCIAGVRYNAAYGFIGLFLVVPEQRGHGYGVRLWRHALEHLADLPCVGLEAAPDRVEDYAGWGFRPASPTVRWQREPQSTASEPLPASSPRGSDRSAAAQPALPPFPGAEVATAASAPVSPAAWMAGPCPASGSSPVVPGPSAVSPAVSPGVAPAVSPAAEGPEWCLVEGSRIPEAAVQRFDARREPSPRPHFLHQWLRHPAGTVLALIDRRGLCHGFGRIRPCLLQQGEGWRIGPLVADAPAVARALLEGLLQRHPGVVLIDAPGANGAADPLLAELGFRPLSRTLRMYRGAVPPAVSLADVYGLACLELG